MSDYFRNETAKVKYFRQYFKDCDASHIIEETHYFDRDYLAEYASFYAVGARGIPNHCRRIHIFSGPVNEEIFWKAVDDEPTSYETLQSNYLGFMVLRPIEHAPFGRTVLKWYSKNSHARNTESSRTYYSHIAGIKLSVRGLAWQQQDACVSTCATVSLWSLLHSSAFDDFHQLPTTAQITQFAHAAIPNGRMTFPSGGLTMEQIGEAIKAYGLSPCIITGDEPDSDIHRQITFSKEKLSNNLASFLRSGYPVLLFGFQVPPEEIGNRNSELHAICAVGFREEKVATSEGTWLWNDSGVKIVYIHDDNLGPGVRFEIHEEDLTGGDPAEAAYLVQTPPEYASETGIFANAENFYPSYIVAAVHQELRSNPETMIKFGSSVVHDFCHFLNIEAEDVHNNDLSLNIKRILESKLVLSTRFIKLTNFLGAELARFFKNENENLLGNVRKKLIQDVGPMSLHLGLIRLGLGNSPVVDILCDTTDPQLKPFCYLSYHPLVGALFQKYCETYNLNMGTYVEAYPSGNS